MPNHYERLLDTSELEIALDSLLRFKSNILDFSFEVFARFPEMVRFEQDVTVGTSLTIKLKPSDGFRDYLLALGTGDAKRFVV